MEKKMEKLWYCGTCNKVLTENVFNIFPDDNMNTRCQSCSSICTPYVPPSPTQPIVEVGKKVPTKTEVKECEKRKCKFWGGSKCTDNIIWQNNEGEEVCRFQEGCHIVGEHVDSHTRSCTPAPEQESGVDYEKAYILSFCSAYCEIGCHRDKGEFCETIDFIREVVKAREQSAFERGRVSDRERISKELEILIFNNSKECDKILDNDGGRDKYDELADENGGLRKAIEIIKG